MRLGLSCGMLHGRALTCFFLRRRIIMVYFNIFAKGVKINVQWRLQQIHRTSINLIAHSRSGLTKKTNWIFTSDTDALNRSGDMQIMPAASQ